MSATALGATHLRHRFLFNFAASYSGGGYKRLREYARRFAGTGGANFIIHPRCSELAKEFPVNRYFVVDRPRYQRLLDDWGYVPGIVSQTGHLDLYYSYGIPVYHRVAAVNWFHLSNVLPLATRRIPLSPMVRLKMQYLGWRIRRHYVDADVISAESRFSLGLIEPSQAAKLFLSVNGSDDELSELQSGATMLRENVATVIGTYSYKCLLDSQRVFEMIRRGNDGLRLIIIGDDRSVPESVRRDPNIDLVGLLDRNAVISCLRKSRYYISTTRIENSYNAASEGVFLADESYVSDIGPHRELLMNMPYDEVRVPQMGCAVLHVERTAISGANLKSWENVVAEMVDAVHAKLRR